MAQFFCSSNAIPICMVERRKAVEGRLSNKSKSYSVCNPANHHHIMESRNAILVGILSRLLAAAGRNFNADYYAEQRHGRPPPHHRRRLSAQSWRLPFGVGNSSCCFCQLHHRGWALSQSADGQALGEDQRDHQAGCTGRRNFSTTARGCYASESIVRGRTARGRCPTAGAADASSGSLLGNTTVWITGPLTTGIFASRRGTCGHACWHCSIIFCEASDQRRSNSAHLAVIATELSLPELRGLRLYPRWSYRISSTRRTEQTWP